MIRRNATREQVEPEAERDRPAGHFALHVPDDVRLVGINDWRPDVPEHAVDIIDKATT